MPAVVQLPSTHHPPFPWLLQFAVLTSKLCTITSAFSTHVIMSDGWWPEHTAKPRQQDRTVWELCQLKGGRVALRDPSSNKYLTACEDGSICPRHHLLEWETWELVRVGDPGSNKFAFRSAHGGQLLQAEGSSKWLRLGPACVAASLKETHPEVFHLQPVPEPAAGQAAPHAISEVISHAGTPCCCSSVLVPLTSHTGCHCLHCARLMGFGTLHASSACWRSSRQAGACVADVA